MSRRSTRTYLVAAFAVALTSAVAPPAARALPEFDGPSGVLCGFDAITDPTAEPGTLSGQLTGGPLVAQDDELNPASGMLICRIQVNDGVHVGYGPQLSGHGTGLVTAGPTLVNFHAYTSDQVYVCTEFVDDRTWSTHYFDAASDEWSDSPDVPCSPASGSGAPVETELVDPIVCPPLALLFPPEGDVPGLWDCPPYGDVFTRESSDNGGGPVTDHPVHKPKRVGYYPVGTITISGTLPGQVSIDYTGFSPGRGQWTCNEDPSLLSVACTPPGAPSGYSGNVCATVQVDVTNSGLGTVQGENGCTGVPSAVAVATGPSGSASDKQQPRADFPWTCKVAPSQPTPAPFSATCTLSAP